jgi:hypothetical protein
MELIRNFLHRPGADFFGNNPAFNGKAKNTFH